MKESVRVYIRTFPPSSRDLELALFSRQHVACAPELLRHDSSLLGGRILDSGSACLLAMLGDVGEGSARRLELHDVGRFRGRLQAAWSGIWSTPAVVIDGHKHIGLAAARSAISAFIAETTVAEAVPQAA